MTSFDYSLITNIDFGGVRMNHQEQWEFENPHISEAMYNGEWMTDEELELLNEDRDYVHEKLMNHFYNL